MVRGVLPKECIVLFRSEPAAEGILTDRRALLVERELLMVRGLLTNKCVVLGNSKLAAGDVLADKHVLSLPSFLMSL